MIMNAEPGMDGQMRLGFLLSEASSKELLKICDIQQDTPYGVIEKCIEIMIKYIDEEEL